MANNGSGVAKTSNGKIPQKNVTTFTVKFFPADAEILEYFQGKENRNRYIKDLIQADMKGQ